MSPHSSHSASTPPRPLRGLAGVLLALALVPALAFAAFQVFAQRESEALLARIRDEQLDALLFSVNQHAWDVTSAWADRLTGLLAASDPGALNSETLAPFFGAVPAVRTVLEADAAGHGFSSLSVGDAAAPAADYAGLFAHARVRRLLERHRIGYRQLDPVPLRDGRLALAFAADGLGPDDPPRLLALVVEPRPFVEAVVMPKLREVSRGGLVLGVFAGDAAEPVAATDALARAEVERERPLWLLPAYTVGVRPTEGSAEGVLRRRLVQSLALIGAVTLVLALGGALVWRGVRREVALARLKEDFVSNVSHELRTPLALIRMYAETLAEGRVPSEARRQQYYQTIVAETERLSRLVGNVLHFNRMQREQTAFASAPLDLSALAAEVAERYRPVLERERLTLTLDLSENLTIAGDHDALAEALVNLLDNAAKYGAGGGEVSVATRVEGERAVVEVADRGPGVPENMRERVFEPFVRIQPTSADGLVHTAKGTGLGLAIVRRIATAHGGTVMAHARPDGGAVFRLSLPLAPLPEPIAA